MDQAQPTVSVSRIEGHNAVKMTWQRSIAPTDVRAAFQQIVAFMEESEQPVHVVVDITSNPRFPLLDTIYGALVPFRHRNMGFWLIIGSNRLAYTIERSLVSLTGHAIVRWLETEEDALVDLQAMSQAEPSS